MREVSEVLRYTGHPLVDVGVATITAFAEKHQPEQITQEDLEEFGKFLEGVYFGEQWRGLMFVIFPNSAYTQPKLSQEKKDSYRSTFIYGFRTEPQDVTGRCVFCGETSLTRGFRQHVPLLTGEGTINFFPWGQAGLPACGLCLLAIQAFLLGSVRCAGRALFVHADDEWMTQEFARRFLTENRRALSLAAGGDDGLRHPRTYFVVRLQEVEQERRQAQDAEQPCSLTVYHLTNYGTNPDIALHHFPSQVVSFLREANRAPHGDTWREIERRGWELAVEKGKRRGTDGTAEAPAAPQPREEPGRARNYLYEDLFDLPNNAARFVRTYFLRRAYREPRSSEADPRRTYNLRRELNLVSWTLTAIFLEKVMNMDNHRIETIRRIADRLAEEISTENNRQLFRGLWMSRHYGDLRRVLVLANTRRARDDREPLLTFDDFVTVFEFGEDSQRPDWSLARDLVLIRVIEQLHQCGWFQTQADVIGEEEIPESAEATVG